MTFLTFIYNLIFYLFDICLLDFKFAVGYWEFVCEGGGGYTCQKKRLTWQAEEPNEANLASGDNCFFVCLSDPHGI